MARKDSSTFWGQMTCHSRVFLSCVITLHNDILLLLLFHMMLNVSHNLPSNILESLDCVLDYVYQQRPLIIKEDTQTFKQMETLFFCKNVAKMLNDLWELHTLPVTFVDFW